MGFEPPLPWTKHSPSLSRYLTRYSNLTAAVGNCVLQTLLPVLGCKANTTHVACLTSDLQHVPLFLFSAEQLHTRVYSSVYDR